MHILREINYHIQFKIKKKYMTLFFVVNIMLLLPVKENCILIFESIKS